MSLLAPLSLLFGLAMVPVIAMYFLKRKRKKVRVPSTYLWLKSIEDMRVNAPFQRLRTSLLLFLQLLLIAVAAVALARPLFHEPQGSGKRLVVLLDRSASMAMTDVEPSRLEAAKAAARAAIRALADGDEAMVIAFSNRAEVVVPFTTDRAAAVGALDAVRPAATSTSVREAFPMAVAAARQRPGSEILVLSDGNFDAVAAHADDVQVRYVPIGGETVNAAITGLDVRRPDAPGDPWTVFAYVEHYSKHPREVMLELYVNARLREVKPVALEAGRGRAAIFEVPGGEAPEFVEVRIGTADHLALDDRAWHVVSVELRKVLVVTMGNFFLEQAVAQYPKLTVERAQPGTVTAADLAGYDAVIFDGHAPPGLGEGRWLFVNCLPDWEGFRDDGAVANAVAVDWDRRHPVTRLLEFSHLVLRSARKVAVPGYVKPLVEGAQGTMISAWVKGESRAIAVHFDVLESDWPLRPSFPLFIGNAIEWLTREGAGEWRAHQMPGDPLRFRLPAGHSRAEIVGPRGDRHSVELEPGANQGVFAKTDELGIYAIRSGGTEQLHVVNLMNPQESSGLVIPELRFGDEAVKGQGAPPPPPREYWPWLAWLALGLLCMEWVVYHRRI